MGFNPVYAGAADPAPTIDLVRSADRGEAAVIGDGMHAIGAEVIFQYS